MKHNFHLVPVHRDPLDRRLYVAALLALAMEQLEAERTARTEAPVAREGRDG